MTIGPPMPSFGAGLRIIQAYALSDCDGKIWLWGKHATPVAGKIALAYLSFDIHGFVKRLIRVPGARQNRHDRKGNRSGRPGPRRRGPGGIPELADMAADIIDPDRDIHPPRYSTPTQFLFVIDDFVERVGYTLMLFETLDELIWEPFAALLRSDARLCPDIPRLFSTSNGTPEGPVWIASSMTTNEVNIGWTQGLGPTTTPLISDAIYIFAGKFNNYSANQNAGLARVQGLEGGDGQVTIELDPDSVGDFIVSGELKRGSTARPMTRSQTSFAAIQSFDCTYFGFGLPE